MGCFDPVSFLVLMILSPRSHIHWVDRRLHARPSTRPRSSSTFRFEGIVQAGRPHGIGMLTRSRQHPSPDPSEMVTQWTRYVGEFDAGTCTPHGWGTLLYGDRQSFEGFVSHGVPIGPGVWSIPVRFFCHHLFRKSV